ncbi:MAG: hypothetical protein FGF51_05875 [Candidatus Brockarchaeota archaeon]|nr:hypothetical protein [Candidatus Brockarchaeota archaeon]
MQYPDDLDEEKVVKKWREAIQQAPSLISSVFENGRLKVMTRKELFDKLEKKGVSYDDIEDVVDEAERKKLIIIDYKTRSAYFWVPPEKREEEKLKTEELEKLVEEAFRERNKEELSRDELKEILASKGLSTDEVERALRDAERDCILSSYPFTKKGWVYELIPLEDRENELEFRRLGKLHDKKWIYRRLSLGLEI